MNIDGKNTLACTDQHGETLPQDHPLPHMPVVKDLVPTSEPVLRPVRLDQALASSTRPWRRKGTPADAGRPRQADGLYECILCACCSTLLPEFLVERRQVRSVRPCCSQAYRFIADTRDGDVASVSTTSKTRTACSAATPS